MVRVNIFKIKIFKSEVMVVIKDVVTVKIMIMVIVMFIISDHKNRTNLLIGIDGNKPIFKVKLKGVIIMISKVIWRINN